MTTRKELLELKRIPYSLCFPACEMFAGKMILHLSASYLWQIWTEVWPFRASVRTQIQISFLMSAHLFRMAG
jgi:hypothetical protein